MDDYTSYESLARISSAEEWERLTQGKPRPIAIWNKTQVRLYYESDEATRAGWNKYAQSVADEEQDALDAYQTLAGCISIDPDTKEITNWAPPLRFIDWKNSQRP